MFAIDSSINNPFISSSVREETANLAELVLDDSFVDSKQLDEPNSLVGTISTRSAESSTTDATPFPYRHNSINRVKIHASGEIDSYSTSLPSFSGFGSKMNSTQSTSVKDNDENVSQLSNILKGKSNLVGSKDKPTEYGMNETESPISSSSNQPGPALHTQKTPQQNQSSDHSGQNNNLFSDITVHPTPSQNTPLLTIEPVKSLPLSQSSTNDYTYNNTLDLERQPINYGGVESGDTEENEYIADGDVRSNSNWKKRVTMWTHENLNTHSILENAVKRPISYLPSVFLGTLLNILDGLSYGLILFPTSIPVFSHLGPSGLSIFYVSCVVSQLCFSLGLSRFPACVGSEMIEVVPFFHIMAGTLVAEIGIDNPQSILATTIVSFSVSSVITGLVFFALGYLKIGNMISFFPRHILVGCIGGVGYFLFITGLGVSSGLGETVPYTFETLKYLIQPAVLLHWTIPLILATALVVVLHYNNGPYVVPFYFVAVFFAIHLIIWAIPGYSLEQAREDSWLFDGPKDRNEPWWYFYTLFDFKAVDIVALLKTVPTMLALTFFGILHVPINVPALAAASKLDDVDVNRELIAHGFSNTLSGLCGSIQNYLVYTNSVFVMKTGADSRMAGIMLAIATMAVMMIGPVVVGYIPVPVVAALIYLLAYDLLKESLWDTFRVANTYEYLTIFSIVAVMGIYDFVWGIVFGIILACGFFTVRLASVSVIRATFTGSVARSTVRRNANIQKYLHHVGDQIYVMKLAGSLFFGTINEVETHVRHLVEDKQFKLQPIRYIILDITNIMNLDFSAIKGFYNIKRKLDQKEVFMLIISPHEEYLQKMLTANEMFTKSYFDAYISCRESPLSNEIPFEDIGKSQRSELLTESSSSENTQPEAFTSQSPLPYLSKEDTDDNSLKYIRLFPDLNSGLEWCENRFLRDYFAKFVEVMETPESSSSSLRPIPSANAEIQSNPFNNQISSSPRFSLIQKAADSAIRTDPEILISRARWKNYCQPLPLLLKTFNGVTTKREDFWHRVAPHFKRIRFTSGQILYEIGEEARGFYVVESGILRADHESKQGNLSELIVAGTTCGELPFFAASTRSARVSAETDTVVWYLGRAEWESLRKQEPDGPEIANELYLIALKFTVERYDTNLAYTLISSA